MCNSGTVSQDRQGRVDRTPAEAPGPWNPAALVAFTFGVICWTSCALCHVVLPSIGPAMPVFEKVTQWADLDATALGDVAGLILAGLLALGLLWLNLNGPVPLAGVVLGILAIRSIRRSRPRQQGQVFAVAGVILSALNLASSAVSLLIAAAMSRPEFWP